MTLNKRTGSPEATLLVQQPAGVMGLTKSGYCNQPLIKLLHHRALRRSEWNWSQFFWVRWEISGKGVERALFPYLSQACVWAWAAQLWSGTQGMYLLGSPPNMESFTTYANHQQHQYLFGHLVQPNNSTHIQEARRFSKPYQAIGNIWKVCTEASFFFWLSRF